MRNHTIAPLVIAAFLLGGLWLTERARTQQGPLEYPPKSEFRTRISKLPFTIDECGSYFLTKCLTGVADQNGIIINADNVTIDLNGFSLSGNGGTLGEGIVTPSAQTNISISNGIIRDWPMNGVLAFVSSHVVFDRVISMNNGNRGLSGGKGSQVLNCVAAGNLNDGISMEAGSYISGCVARDNADQGILITGSAGTSFVVDCISTGNNIGFGVTSNTGQSHFDRCHSSENNTGYNSTVGSATAYPRCTSTNDTIVSVGLWTDIDGSFGSY